MNNVRLEMEEFYFAVKQLFEERCEFITKKRLAKIKEIVEELHRKVDNKINYSENDDSDEPATISEETANLNIYELRDQLEGILNLL